MGPDVPASSARIDSRKFRVAVVGAGIGGVTAVLSLFHHCPELAISVYEQAPQYKEIGAGIGGGVNAPRILHKIGLGKAANEISGERDGIHRSNRGWDNGEETITVDAMDETRNKEMRQLSVHRAEFLEVLVRAVQKGGAARLSTDKRAVKIEVDAID